MELQGFCTIKKGALTCAGTDHPEWFVGKDCVVMEFDSDGGVLVIDFNGRGMASFDKEDVYRKFECQMMADVICPPKLNTIDKLLYCSKVHARKGGYNHILKDMVIQASLFKGEFHDDFLFQTP